jgi:hypothetical protein
MNYFGVEFLADVLATRAEPHPTVFDPAAQNARSEEAVVGRIRLLF